MTQPGTLFIVATPIGNLQDISLRALETLKVVDLILAEDTRHTGLLLAHFSITTQMISFHDHNETTRIPEIITKLTSGKSIALVSDAGTPLISDPGYKLVRECIARTIPIDSIPGATAAVAALTVSGLPPDKFFFVGFLPEKTGKRKKLLESLPFFFERNEAPYRLVQDEAPYRLVQDEVESGSATVLDYTPLHSSKNLEPTIKATIIIYESPYKLLRTLAELTKHVGDRQIVICRELTKLHQEVFRGRISEAATHFAKPKGEFVILL